jgi:hypothetical protein
MSLRWRSGYYVLLASLLSVFWCGGGMAAGADYDADPAHHQQRLEKVQDATRDQYRATLSWYDDYLGNRRYDVVAAVERCRFIGAFTASFEYLDWLDDAYAEQTACDESLAARYPQHAEVELYRLEKSYGEQLLAEGERLLEASRPGEWTEGQLSRLYARLAVAYEQSNQARAKQLALQALEKDLTADVRLIAARGLIAEQQREQALDILLSPFDDHDAKDYWRASEKMRLLVSLNAVEPALQVYEATKASGATYDNITAAKLLRELHAVEEAREELKQAAAVAWNAGRAAAELFQLEFEDGSPQAALSAYEAMRDRGLKEDPLAINRVALLARDLGLPWQWRDLLGIGVAMGAVAAAGLLMLIPIGAVHYRGLARRVRTNEPLPPAEGWQLRHAWLALMVLVASEFVSLYLCGPLRLSLEAPMFGLEEVRPEAVARLAIAGEVTALLLAVMLALAARSAVPKWIEHWSVTKAVLVALGLAVLCRIPLLLSVAASPQSVEPRLLVDPVLQMVGYVREHFGVLSALWWMAIAAPVLEEFVFRGVLREAFAKHVSLGWANVLQAGLFAVWHQNLRALPMLFLFGLMAGALARRSGGLLAPILLHAAFNLAVGLVLFL